MLEYVQMIRTAPGAWTVIKEDGWPLDVTGTQTEGLQEAIDYACAGGHSLVVDGGGCRPCADDSVITCSAGIVFPPMQRKMIDLNDVTLSFGGSVPVGLEFDSCMMVNFNLRGQVAFSNPAPEAIAVRFRPLTQLPIDPTKTIVDSEFFIHTIAVNNGTAVKFDCNASTGAIGGNRFRFVEVNGGLVGIGVSHPAEEWQSFTSNHISVPHLHRQSAIGVSVGDYATNRIYGNTWHVDAHPLPSCNPAFRTWAKWDRINLNVHGSYGHPAVGLKYELTAGQNWGCVVLNDAETKVQNLSTFPNPGYYGM